MSARLAAAALVSAVTDDRRTLDEALDTNRFYAALEGRDRAFARAIASATLRRLGGIDALLAEHLAKPLPDEARTARAMLRTGAAQMLVLGTPPHAAVGETVALAKSGKSAAGFAKLINAVLRRIGERGPDALSALPPGADLPDWLFARWRAVYGPRAEEIARALKLEPPLDLTAKANPDGLAARLGAQRIGDTSLRLGEGHRDVRDLDGYDTGDWWVQDVAAALPAQLLREVGGKEVIDLCAAPGGKSMQLAAAGAHVTALDVDGDRLGRVRENLGRTGLSAHVVNADALVWRPQTQADAVLLDAPCTATGTLRRNPDVAWLRRPTDIPKLAELQRALVDAAWEMLKPGGALVYAVCSLEPEEGEAIATAALSTGRWRLARINPEDAPGLPDAVTSEGFIRTLPSHLGEIGGMDGFFAMRLIKQA
jgi:16S rRNA (cytosine967-C5)-methyltransferase